MTMIVPRMTRRRAAKADPELLFCDGLDGALIGVVRQFGRPPIACYDYQRCVAILVQRDGLTPEEAEEHLEFNTLGAWVGEFTPCFFVRP